MPTSSITNDGTVSIASCARARPSFRPRTLPLITDMTSTRRWPGAAQCGSAVSSARAASPTGPSSTSASARTDASTTITRRCPRARAAPAGLSTRRHSPPAGSEHRPIGRRSDQGRPCCADVAPASPRAPAGTPGVTARALWPGQPGRLVLLPAHPGSGEQPCIHHACSVADRAEMFDPPGPLTESPRPRACIRYAGTGLPSSYERRTRSNRGLLGAGCLHPADG